MAAASQRPVSLTHATEEQPFEDPFTRVDVRIIEDRLQRASYVGGGGFCRVYSLDTWDVRYVQGKRSPCYNQPVIIKISSPHFKVVTGSELVAEQMRLQSHYLREKHAHIVLAGQPHVVQLFHTFEGVLQVPVAGGMRVPMQVLGFVEECCSLYSLNHFLAEVEDPQLPWRRRHLTLQMVATQIAALAEQVRALDRIGVAHQDLNLMNILAHEEPHGSGDVQLKLGDLNLVQWKALLVDGGYWGGTVGFMPARVQRLYNGQQRYPVRGVGELNHDTFSLGKVLLRLLESMRRPGLEPASPRRGDDLQAEDAAVKQAAVQLVFQPSAPGEAPVELFALGVLCGLLMAWDGDYTGEHDLLRLTPAEAAEALADWADICTRWSKAQGEAFWQQGASVQAMAELYLKLCAFGGILPLGGPRVAGVHKQQDEYSITVAESFFNIGSGERLALVRARVEELLAAGEQPLQPASRPQGGGRAALQPVQGNRLQQPGGRALQPAKAQHKQRQQQVAQADSVEAAVGRENAFLAAPRGQLAGGKRKASNSQASINQELRQRGAAPANSEPSMEQVQQLPGGGDGGGERLICLCSSLKLADLFPGGIKPAGAPQLLGTRNRTALALAQAVRSMLVAAPGKQRVEMRPGTAQPLSLRLACVAGRRGEQVVVSRADFEALLACPAACAKWNAAAKLLGASYATQKDDAQARVAVLKRDLGAAAV